MIIVDHDYGNGFLDISKCRYYPRSKQLFADALPLIRSNRLPYNVTVYGIRKTIHFVYVTDTPGSISKSFYYIPDEKGSLPDTVEYLKQRGLLSMNLVLEI